MPRRRRRGQHPGARRTAAGSGTTPTSRVPRRRCGSATTGRSTGRWCSAAARRRPRRCSALADLGCRHATLLVRDAARADETVAAGGPAPARRRRSRSVRWRRRRRLDGRRAGLDDPGRGAGRRACSRSPSGCRVVFDVVYDPWPTPLGRRRRRAPGGSSSRGLDLLVHQAVLQVELMTGGRAGPAGGDARGGCRGAGRPVVHRSGGSATSARGHAARVRPVMTWYLDTALAMAALGLGDRGAGARADRPGPGAGARPGAGRRARPGHSEMQPAADEADFARPLDEPEGALRRGRGAARAVVEVRARLGGRPAALIGARVGWHPVLAAAGASSSRCASRSPSWTGAPGSCPPG